MNIHNISFLVSNNVEPYYLAVGIAVNGETNVFAKTQLCQSHKSWNVIRIFCFQYFFFFELRIVFGEPSLEQGL